MTNANRNLNETVETDTPMQMLTVAEADLINGGITKAGAVALGVGIVTGGAFIAAASLGVLSLATGHNYLRDAWNSL